MAMELILAVSIPSMIFPIVLSKLIGQQFFGLVKSLLPSSLQSITMIDSLKFAG